MILAYIDSHTVLMYHSVRKILEDIELHTV